MRLGTLKERSKGKGGEGQLWSRTGKGGGSQSKEEDNKPDSKEERRKGAGRNEEYSK